MQESGGKARAFFELERRGITMLGAGSRAPYVSPNVRSPPSANNAAISAATTLRIAAIVFAVLAGLQMSCEKESAQTDLQRGMKAYDKGNFAEACRWLGSHLRRNPADAGAYDCRGRAREETGDLEGALADFDCAIGLNPDLTNALVHRALARKKRGDIDGALADFGAVIEIDPKNALACYDRGNLRSERGDLEGAIADYTLALDLDSKDAPCFFNRGIAFYLRRDWPRAREDFDAAARQDKPQEYGWLFSCAVRMRSGQIESARGELRDNLKKRRGGKRGDWFSKLASFLLGELDEAALLAAAGEGTMAKARDQLCEAWYFAGMAHLSAAQRAEAADCFGRCIGTGRKSFAEHSLAEAELRALDDEAKTSSAGGTIARRETFRGRVAAVTATSLTLRDKETGKSATFAVSREAKVTLDGRRTSIERIRPAMDATLIFGADGRPASIEATTKAEPPSAAGRSGRTPAAR